MRGIHIPSIQKDHPTAWVTICYWINNHKGCPCLWLNHPHPGTVTFLGIRSRAVPLAMSHPELCSHLQHLLQTYSSSNHAPPLLGVLFYRIWALAFSAWSYLLSGFQEFPRTSVKNVSLLLCKGSCRFPEDAFSHFPEVLWGQESVYDPLNQRQALSTQLHWATRMSMKLFLSPQKRNKDTLKLGFELFSINSPGAGRKGHRDQDLLEPILVKAPHVIWHSNQYLITLGNATVVMGTLRVTVLSGEVNHIVIRWKMILRHKPHA